MKERVESLADEVHNLQVDFLRRINDSYIFAQQAVPLLQEAQQELGLAAESKKKYYVPSLAVGKRKFAERTDAQLREIYSRFIERELYENLIVTAVSQFESFLFSALRLIIFRYPKKLNLNVGGLEIEKTIPLDLLLNADSKEDAVRQVIEQTLNRISYAGPTAYLGYLKGITHVDTTDTAFNDFFEIKATRDLIIHNLGVINETYLTKVREADKTPRGPIGDRIPIDDLYFSHCIATLKQLSSALDKGISANFTKTGQSKKKSD